MTIIAERYNKRVAPVDAVRYVATMAEALNLAAWLGNKAQFSLHLNLGQAVFIVGTPNGNKTLSAGDWIVRDAANRFEVVQDVDFAKEFEKEAP